MTDLAKQIAIIILEGRDRGALNTVMADEILALLPSHAGAATPWQKFSYDQNALGQPRQGEWCLWSMVISGQRNYFSGSWRMYGDKNEPLVTRNGGTSYKIDDTVYWARVNHL